MKPTLNSMLPLKHIAITAAAVVSFAHAARAEINLEFVYDTVTNTTTATYTGTWGVNSGINFRDPDSWGFALIPFRISF